MGRVLTRGSRILVEDCSRTGARHRGREGHLEVQPWFRKDLILQREWLHVLNDEIKSFLGKGNLFVSPVLKILAVLGRGKKSCFTSPTDEGVLRALELSIEVGESGHLPKRVLLIPAPGYQQGGCPTENQAQGSLGTSVPRISRR